MPRDWLAWTSTKGSDGEAGITIMSMVLLAMLFLADLRKRLAEKAPLLTLQDAKDILGVVMPKKQLSLEDAVKIIRKKHLNRLRSRKSRLKRQKIPKTQ